MICLTYNQFSVFRSVMCVTFSISSALCFFRLVVLDVISGHFVGELHKPDLFYQLCQIFDELSVVCFSISCMRRDVSGDQLRLIFDQLSVCFKISCMFDLFISCA